MCIKLSTTNRNVHVAVLNDHHSVLAKVSVLSYQLLRALKKRTFEDYTFYTTK